MTRTSQPAAVQFVDYVLSTRPRIAVFDCDGTLWSGDSGAQFFDWELDRGLVSPEVAKWITARYDLYKADKVDEVTICGEMVTMNRGVPESTLRSEAAEFFALNFEQRLFPELLELTTRLSELGCELWAVSSTNNWVVEEGARRFGIPRERVLAACVEIENGLATDRLIRVPTDELKATAIHEVIRCPVDAIFGNSMHDLAMLEIARDAFAVNPNPDLENAALERGWTVYHPAIARP